MYSNPGLFLSVTHEAKQRETIAAIINCVFFM
jgi:hypothetical protein